MESTKVRPLHAVTSLLVAALLTTACGDSGTETGALQPSVAIAYGQVTTGDGLPVGDVVVSVFGNVECADSSEEWLAGTATTGGDGSYRAFLTYLHVSSADACLTVRAAPPSGSGLRGAVVTGAAVTFVHQTNTPPVDSVEVPVELPAAR